MKKIFVDTNIFLHFRFFTDINWLDACQDDKCKIIIAPIVIDELDKLKVGTDARSKRARNALQKIEYYSEIQSLEIQSNVEIEIINTKPKKKTFTRYHLNPDEHDNQLIACIIEYQSCNKDNNVFLCSYDIGPRLRSKQHGIGILKLPDTYLLPDKDSELDKQIKSLVEENKLLKTKVSKPTLQFENEKDFIKIKISEYVVNKTSFINSKIGSIKSEFPYLKLNEKQDINNPLAPLASFNIISEEQIDRYNSELDEYFSNYLFYLSSLFDYELKTSLSVRIVLLLTNTGNVPCNDVDIYCHFPDGFHLIEEDDLEFPPKEPYPPNIPKSFFENLTRGLNFSRLSIPTFDNPILPKLGRPSIRKTNSYEVHFSRDYVKHLTIYPLDTLVAVYNSFTDIKNYTIDYTIIAGNISEPINGKLNIIFEKNNAS